jgi:hypothetical protein
MVRIAYYGYIKGGSITGQMSDEGKIEWALEYRSINEREVWCLINENFIIDDGFPEYKRCKKSIAGKIFDDVRRETKFELEYCAFKLNPALYRDLDTQEYGGFWIPKRPFCLEHFILFGFIFLIGSGAVRFLEWVIGHFL